jgi:16S rRNA (cytosine1402-N4)-methyltransferase
MRPARGQAKTGRGKDGRTRQGWSGRHARRGPADGRPPEVAPDAPAADRHIPVLLREVLSFLEPASGQRYLDATLGLGGHSEAMLRKAAQSGASDVRLLGLDRDAAALALAEKRLAPFGRAALTGRCRFSDCDAALAGHEFTGVDFALADIGVSSMQLDTPERGFSFSCDGPLDMRMDPGAGQSASALVNAASVTRLREIIREYGEDPMAGRIARAIDDARAVRRIESTLELAGIVERAYPAKWRAASRNHPATRTFQALRMAVNDELGELELFLRKIVRLLRPGGRVAVITFHSLEDRMVKHFFRDEAASCLCPPQTPVCVCARKPTLRVLTRKPLCASAQEAAVNPRAGSAKLRVAERLPHD